MFQASIEHLPLLRSVGYQGVCVTLIIQVGLRLEGVSRHTEAYHRLYCCDDALEIVDDDEEGYGMHENTDLVFCVQVQGPEWFEWDQVGPGEVLVRVDLERHPLLNSFIVRCRLHDQADDQGLSREACCIR